MAQVAVALVIVQAAADHEDVWDTEPDPFHRHLHLPPGWFVQQGTDGQAARPAPGQQLADPMQGMAGIDDVLDT